MHRVQESSVRVGKKVRTWHRSWDRTPQVTEVEDNGSLSP